MESTLEKLKSQCPTIELPEAANQTDHFDENSLPDAIKPLNDTSTSSMMDISRLVTHLTRAVVAARERVTALLQELHPLKEKIAMLQDDCEEKKKVSMPCVCVCVRTLRIQSCCTASISPNAPPRTDHATPPSEPSIWR